MIDLSERQRQLLKAIIELYVKSGEPISSDLIEKSYDLGVSPATIRNEMVRLTDAGFLKQPHTSAGRVPTAMGFRLYVNELMQERQVPIVDEVSIRQQVLDARAQFDRMMQIATRALAKKCATLAVAVANDDLYYAGAAYILDLQEFYDIDVTRFVLGLFDENPRLREIIGRGVGSDPVHILFGEDMEFEYLKPTGFVFTRYSTDANGGVLGVIGPARMNFSLVLPYVKYVRDLVTEAMLRS